MSKPEVVSIGQPSVEESRNLAIAFYCILEPDRRAEVLALAEKYAMESQAMDGIPHFSAFGGRVRH